MNQVDLQKILTLDDVPATILNWVALEHCGAFYYHWEPETLHSELLRDSGLPEIQREVLDKLQAMATLLVSDQFYQRWEVFEKIGQAFNHQPVFFDQATPLEAPQMVWVLLESRLNDDTPSTFTTDVAAYIKTSLKCFGLVQCPKIIQGIFENYGLDMQANQEMQNEKQLYIEKYCKLQLKKIVELSEEFLGHDPTTNIFQEIPFLKNKV